MKTKISFLVFSFFLLSIISVGQTLTLSFDGQNNGQVVALEKVFIENLDKSCDTTLFYPNSTVTLQVLGIENPVESPTRLTVFQNVPNPVLETTAIKIFNPSSENVSIVVQDLFGRPVCTYHANLERGYHIFNFSPGKAGTYFFSVSSPGVSQSIKITSSMLNTYGAFSLRYSGKVGHENSLKVAKSGPFVFSSGDSLRYTGYYQSMTKTLYDSPQSNKTYTFTFSSTGFTCGQNLTINHAKSGGVAPVNKTTTYGTVTNIPGETAKCWLTSNLGSDHQATSVTDNTEASAGWYWQFNRKKGYKHDGSTLTPAWTITSINEISDWLVDIDPCNLELGTAWRLPTYTEWYNVDNTGGWTNWNGPWGSGLKLHAAGYLYYSNGSLLYRGSYGCYWSNTQYDSSYGWYLGFGSGLSDMYNYHKAYGYSARCLRDN